MDDGCFGLLNCYAVEPRRGDALQHWWHNVILHYVALQHYNLGVVTTMPWCKE